VFERDNQADAGSVQKAAAKAGGTGVKAFVTQLYSKGKSVPNKKLKTHSGELGTISGEHPILGRICPQVMLLGDNGINVIPCMYDYVLIRIAMKGMKFRGFEVNGDTETAQEWWVRFEE
jgi:hypothetical protein